MGAYLDGGGWSVYLLAVLAAVCLLAGGGLLILLGRRVRAVVRVQRRLVQAGSTADPALVASPGDAGQTRLMYLLRDVESLGRGEGDRLLAEELRTQVRGPGGGWWVAVYLYAALACLCPVLCGAAARLGMMSDILDAAARMGTGRMFSNLVDTALEEASSPMQLGVVVALVGVAITAVLWALMARLSAASMREAWLEVAAWLDLVADPAAVRRLVVPRRRSRAAIAVVAAGLCAAGAGVLAGWQRPASVPDRVFYFAERPLDGTNRMVVPPEVELVQGAYRNTPRPSHLLVLGPARFLLDGRPVHEPIEFFGGEQPPDRYARMVVPEQDGSWEERLRRRWLLVGYKHALVYERLQELAGKSRQIARFTADRLPPLSVVVAADARLPYERVAPVLAAVHTAGIENVYLASAVDGAPHLAAALPVRLRVGPRTAPADLDGDAVQVCSSPPAVLAAAAASWREVLGLCHRLAPADGRPVGLVAAPRGALPELPPGAPCIPPGPAE